MPRARAYECETHALLGVILSRGFRVALKTTTIVHSEKMVQIVKNRVYRVQVITSVSGWSPSHRIAAGVVVHEGETRRGRPAARDRSTYKREFH
jgi:hypothetical protein